MTLFNNADEVLEHALKSKQQLDRNIVAENEPIVIPPDAVWVVDAKSGCHFLGPNLIHTDSCLCDKDDQ